MSAVVYRLPTAAAEKIINPRKYGPWKKSGNVDGSYWPRLQIRRKAEYLAFCKEDALRCQKYREAEVAKALQAAAKGHP